MLRRMFLTLVTVAVASASFAQNPAPSTADLSGTWRFVLDRSDAGLDARWFAEQLSGVDTVKIPGILQAQGYGDEISVDTPWVAGLPCDMRWSCAAAICPLH